MNFKFLLTASARLVQLVKGSAFFVLTLFLFNSCKKSLIVGETDNLKNTLSIAEAKSFFNSNLRDSKKKLGGASMLSNTPTLQELLANKQPIWDKAYKKLVSTGGAVQIPLDFGEIYTIVDPQAKAMVPTASLNYLLMYKDDLENIHAEWVTLKPDLSWLKGDRSFYKGSILISDWDGRPIKKYVYGSSAAKQQPAGVQSGDPGGQCYWYLSANKCTCPWAFKNGAWDMNACDGCQECLLMVCFEENPKNCSTCVDPPATPVDGGGGSGIPASGGGDNGGGTSTQPVDYAPNCSSEEGYQAPDYPAPDGMEWVMPCSGSGVPVPDTPLEEPRTTYEGLDISDGVLTLAIQLELSDAEAIFLENNPAIFNTVRNYLNQNPTSEDAGAFARWAVGYLMANPNFDYNIFFDENEFSRIDSPPANITEEPLIDNGITDSEIPSNVNNAFPKLIAQTTNRNNTEDMKYGTDGNGSGILTSRLQASSPELFADMIRLFTICTSLSPTLRTVGLDMIDRFKYSSGVTYENASLNGEVGESATFKNFVRKFGSELKIKLKTSGGDINAITPFNLDYRPIFNGLYNKFAGFQILINDTEYTEIKILNYKIDPATQAWIADLEVTITDHFGLDKNDALVYQGKHRGFASWWVLQHKKGHRPFETKITVRRRIYGSL
jgi:hypothetical protein